MDAHTLREKSEEALVKELEEARNALAQWRFKLSSHQLKDVREIRQTKRTIARIKTLLRARQSTNADSRTTHV